MALKVISTFRHFTTTVIENSNNNQFQIIPNFIKTNTNWYSVNVYMLSLDNNVYSNLIYR